jgi:transcriptional regulator with XRE-family HTH domain
MLIVKKGIIMTSEEIKKLRKQARMTQQEFAIALGLGISTVQKWDAGGSPSRMAINLLRDFKKTLLRETAYEKNKRRRIKGNNRKTHPLVEVELL